MMITIVIIYCRYDGTRAVSPLSYRGGYLNFSARFMKNAMLVEQKKIKSLNKTTFCWKLNKLKQHILKNVVCYLFKYEMNFYWCFPKCFCTCKCGPLNGCRESTEIIIIIIQYLKAEKTQERWRAQRMHGQFQRNRRKSGG